LTRGCAGGDSRKFGPWLHQFSAGVGPWLHGFRDVDHVAGDAWLSAPRSGLALVIALDQFSRNIWRGSNAAFDLDPLAREAAGVMIARGFDFAFSEVERPSSTCPSCIPRTSRISTAASNWPPSGWGRRTRRCAMLSCTVKSSSALGAFPYRNAALGRDTTPEEQAYLDGGGYAPGSKRPAKSTEGQE
jgi:hypothetical protein